MAILTLREAFKKDLVEAFLPADPVRESPFFTSAKTVCIMTTSTQTLRHPFRVQISQ